MFSLESATLDDIYNVLAAVAGDVGDIGYHDVMEQRQVLPLAEGAGARALESGHRVLSGPGEISG